jgi:hypothetical protein
LLVPGHVASGNGGRHVGAAQESVRQHSGGSSGDKKFTTIHFHIPGLRRRVLSLMG